MLTQALRVEGINNLPPDNAEYHLLWEKLLHYCGNKTRSELLTDIGLGKRIAGIVAKRLLILLQASGEKRDALLITRESFAVNETVTQGGIVLDGVENSFVRFGACCRPVPGDAIVGHLGRGKGLSVHVDDCAVAVKLQNKDSEQFISVEWSDEPARPFETGVLVTVTNGKGVLARVAAGFAAAEVDITHIDMDEESMHDTTDLRFVIAVRDRNQLEEALRSLRKVPAVLKAQRAKNVH